MYQSIGQKNEGDALLVENGFVVTALSHCYQTSPPNHTPEFWYEGREMSLLNCSTRFWRSMMKFLRLIVVSMVKLTHILVMESELINLQS